MLYAGHGMIREGSQCIVLNQFDAKYEFYQLRPVERDIRLISGTYKNSYLVGIFACCREIFIPKIHCACVWAADLAEAKHVFEEKDKAEQMKNDENQSLQDRFDQLSQQFEELKAAYVKQ